MQYLIILILLFVFILLYFKVADKYNIVDKPNERSSHSIITLRGGGIIFWVASLFYFIQNIEDNYLFFIGITLVSVVSFWDDIQSLSNKIRLLTHFAAITLIFYGLGAFDLPIWLIIASYIIAIGIINAYNFMDGINGITGVYTLTVLSSLLYVNEYMFKFTDSDFIIYPALASIVFLVFNYRKKAKCFAGDVGSIAIAFWIIYLLLKLILFTDSLVWMMFLIVYGVDTICTIMHRLYLQQNIFEAHRLHFYQILSNEYKIQHRIVALIYGIIQAIASVVIIKLYNVISDFQMILIIALPLFVTYLIKFSLLKKQI